SDGRATAFVRGGTPPFQYRWSNGGNTAGINALPAGTYGVTVNDGAGCLDSVELEILQPTELLANLNSTNESQPNAADGSASVAPSGGTPPYTVLWSTGGNQLSISNLTPNTYGVTVSDANDCSVSRTFEIEEAVCNLEKVREESIAVSCFGESDGSAFVEVRNGFPPYEYNWSDGQDGAIASNLRAATYTLTVTDQAGCRILDTVVVGSPPALIVLIQVESESEVGAGDGSASANVIGGTPPYDIQWFDGSEDAQITGLSNGTYSLTVTDANDCQQVEEFELLGPLNCQTRSGQMDTSQVFFVCGRSEVRATLLGGVVLDNDDVLEFVLHDRNDGELGRVFARSSDPVFRYQSNLQFGQSYFIAALAGNDNGSSQADENDPCLSVSTGVEVSFGKEPVSPYAVQGPEIVCGNESFELEVTDLYPDSSVDYRWILPTGDTLFTEDRFLTITATSTAFTGDYFAIRDSAGCTSSLSPPLFIEVLSLAIEEIDAGADRVVCSDDAISLSALEPSVGSGFWSTTSSAILSTPGMSTTQARDLQGGENVFVWTVVVDEC
ncbi:MAG: SprB repeat-containing protein, partial [Bacteroidota bacterium]